MKKYISFLASACLSLGLVTSQAQSSSQGRSTDGPHFDGATGKLFGENQSFTAALEFQMTDPASGNSLTMPGKISFDAGKSRFEMNMADMKGTKLRPGAAAHMKSMGMDQTINISRPDKKVAWLVYPGMQSYVENQLTDAAAAVTDAYDYDAFGNLLHVSGSTPNEHLYSGEQFDANLGFYNLRARLMNPTTGRFLTMDSFEGVQSDPRSLHKYLYGFANPVTNAEFTKTLGKVLSRPTLFPIPAFGVRLAFGEMADEMMLSSTRVAPKVLNDAGFRFQYPELEGAVRAMLN